MDKELISTALKTLLTNLGFPNADIETLVDEKKTTLNVQITKDASFLIGQNGETLRALHHVLVRMLESSGAVNYGDHLSIDINGYQQKHIEHIQENARSLAMRVQSLRHEIELPPMNSYERLVVHDAVKNMPHVETESRGEGKLRHVVIAYKE